MNIQNFVKIAVFSLSLLVVPSFYAMNPATPPVKTEAEVKAEAAKTAAVAALAKYNTDAAEYLATFKAAVAVEGASLEDAIQAETTYVAAVNNAVKTANTVFKTSNLPAFSEIKEIKATIKASAENATAEQQAALLATVITDTEKLAFAPATEKAPAASRFAKIKAGFETTFGKTNAHYMRNRAFLATGISGVVLAAAAAIIIIPVYLKFFADKNKSAEVAGTEEMTEVAGN